MTATRPKIIVIDDDPLFGNVMAAVAKRRGLDVDFYDSLLDLGSISRLEDYDAAIVDYDLGTMNGLEIGEHLGAFLHQTPLILVSATNQIESQGKPWAAAIRAFVHKDKGYEAILDATLAALARPLGSRPAAHRQNDAQITAGVEKL